MESFLLKFGSMDGQDGELNKKPAGTPLREEVPLRAGNVREAVADANSILKRMTSLHHIPFMPELFNDSGERIAATIAQPPHAHRLTWIKGAVVGSIEEWVPAQPEIRI